MYVSMICALMGTRSDSMMMAIHTQLMIPIMDHVCCDSTHVTSHLATRFTRLQCR